MFAAASGCGEKTPAQLEKERRENMELAVKRARVLLFENNPLKAVEILENASKQWGVDADLCETLANAYAQSGQIGFAAMFFDKASDLKGGDPELQISAAKSYEQSASLESAVKSYEKYLKMRPQDTVVWKTLARNYEKLGLMEQSMNALMSSIRTSGRNPNSAEAAQVGLLFLKLGNTIQSQRWLTAAYAATLPENKQVRKDILLGLIQIRLAEKDAANLDRNVAELDAIDPSALDANFPQLRKKIAEFKKSLKEAQDALAAEKLAEEEKKKAEEAAKKAQAEAKQTAAAQGVKDAQVAVSQASAPDSGKADSEKKGKEATPESSRSEKKAADSAADSKSGDSEKKSAGEEKQGETKTPQMEDATVKDAAEKPAPKEKSPAEKIYEAIEKNDLKNAEQMAHKAVADDPDSHQAWTALSKTYEAEGKNNDAFLAAGEALNRNPDDIDATLYYLRTASKVQNNERFLNSLYAARKKFPRNAEILIGLARTYKEMGDRKNSEFFYRTFLNDVRIDHPRYKEIEDEYGRYSAQDKK